MPYTCPGCYKTCSDFEPHTCATYSNAVSYAAKEFDPLTGEMPPTDAEEFIAAHKALLETAGKKPGLTNVTVGEWADFHPAPVPTHLMCDACGVWHKTGYKHVCLPPADGKVVPQPISGVGHCPKCGYDYPRAAGHAVCQPAEQRTFFVLPPEPVAVAWSLQWRWTPATQQILALTIPADQLPTNDWVPHTAYQNVTTKAQARNAANRYRRVFPCKKWRVRPTSWRDHEGGIYQVVI